MFPPCLHRKIPRRNARRRGGRAPERETSTPRFLPELLVVVAEKLMDAGDRPTLFKMSLASRAARAAALSVLMRHIDASDPNIIVPKLLDLPHTTHLCYVRSLTLHLKSGNNLAYAQQDLLKKVAGQLRTFWISLEHPDPVILTRFSLLINRLTRLESLSYIYVVEADGGIPETLRSFEFPVPPTVRRLTFGHIPLESPGLKKLPAGLEQLTFWHMEPQFHALGHFATMEDPLLENLAAHLAQLPNLRIVRVQEKFEGYKTSFWENCQAPFAIKVAVQ